MLKILTLNLNYHASKHGPWPLRQQLISSAIQRLQPDIVAFQAVRRDPNLYDGLDQATQISLALPQYAYTAFEAATIDAAGCAQGSAFLSRFRILESDYQPLTFLPGLDDPNHRIVLHGLFDLPECPFHLFNAHFSWVPDQAALNVPEAINYASCFKGYKALVGDFNQTPDSDPLRIFERRAWTDCWQRLHPDAEGFTFEAPDPSLRIDYIWADEELITRLAGIEIVTAEDSHPNLHLSDHFGLMASFESW